jgi:hypothetical protein
VALTLLIIGIYVFIVEREEGRETVLRNAIKVYVKVIIECTVSSASGLTRC